MTITLDLPLDVTQAYRAAAEARGLPVEEVMREALVAAQPGNDDAQLRPEEWVQKLDAWSARNAGTNLSLLSDEALRRESLYEDRGL